MRWGPRWSLNEAGPLAHAAGAPVVPKRKRPSRPCGGGHGGPKAKAAPSPMRWGPRWSQSKGGPLAQSAGASVNPKRKRPPRPRRGGRGGPETKETLAHTARAAVVKKSEESPFAHAAEA